MELQGALLAAAGGGEGGGTPPGAALGGRQVVRSRARMGQEDSACYPTHYQQEGESGHEKSSSVGVGGLGDEENDGDGVQVLRVPSVSKNARKKGNTVLRQQFEERPGQGGGRIFRCNHCKKAVQRSKKFNATTAMSHIDICARVPQEIRAACAQNTQRARKQAEARSLAMESGLSIDCQATNPVLASSIRSSSSASRRRRRRSSETVAVSSVASMFRSRPGLSDLTSSSQTKKQKKTAGTPARQLALVTQWGQSLTKAQADALLRGMAESALARLEPLDRFDDEFVKAYHCKLAPGLAYHWINSRSLYDRFVADIDSDTIAQLNDYFQRIPGCMFVGCDSVTVHGSRHLLYTVSKGNVTMFEALQNLQDSARTTESEVEQGMLVIKRALDKFQCDTCILSVENCAVPVADRIQQFYMDENPSKVVLICRDPADCLDLGAKDSAREGALKEIIDQATDVVKFCNFGAINGLREKLMGCSAIPFVPPAEIFPANRFWMTCNTLEAVINQRPFAYSLAAQADYSKFYNIQTPSQQKFMDAVMGRMASNQFWDRLQKAMNWFNVFKNATQIVCAMDVPISVYFPVCLATRNGLNAILEAEDGGGTFVEILGECAEDECAKIVRSRFNLNGRDPEGRKGGLLEEWHIWAFLVDPFARDLQPEPFIEGGVYSFVKSMVKHFVPGSTERDELKRKRLQMDFMQFHTQTGKFTHLFDHPRPGSEDPEVTKEKQTGLNLNTITQWLKDSSGADARHAWWMVNAPSSELYECIAKPLLSVRTTGSITAERVANTLNDSVLTMKRNWLEAAGSSHEVLRAGINLRFLQAVEKLDDDPITLDGDILPPSRPFCITMVH
jgi:hypothetical protein